MDDELVTPADVEREMADLNRRISDAPAVIKKFHNSWREKQAEYRRAYAVAYSSATGTQMDKRFAADLETQEEREQMDLAEIEYRYVRDTMDSLKTKLRALQSIGSMLRAEMFNAHQGGI